MKIQLFLYIFIHKMQVESAHFKHHNELSTNAVLGTDNNVFQLSRVMKNLLFALVISAFVFLDVFDMWRSHQPRFHPDLNRGLYRERVGVVLSAPIRSYHDLMSILTIGLIVEKILAAKTFPPINMIASTIGTIATDSMTS